ncbi:MAG TPA: hypothetical protein VGI93_16215 [Steroidobacteraceae bacterium]|jgi:quercetin dioxygenase-like cupin family protein
MKSSNDFADQMLTGEPHPFVGNTKFKQKRGVDMNRMIAFAGSLGLLFSSALVGQDAMQYGVKHLKVLAEDDKVRVLEYSPKKGDKTPMHSHPSSVVYVLKGGRVKYTLPDGSSKISELKSGATLLRPPVTHADEALDDVDAILIELKK